MKIVTELEINTVEELYAYLSSISIQPIEFLSVCPLSTDLSNPPSDINIHENVLNILDLKIFEILWSNQIYFRVYSFNNFSEDSSKLFQVIRSSLKYDHTKKLAYGLKTDYNLPEIMNKLSNEQISALIVDNLITIEDVTNKLKYTYTDVNNLINFALHNGWDVASKGLQQSMNYINLDNIRLALKKGLKSEYVIEHLNEVYDLTTQLKLISAAVDSGYKLDDLAWRKLKPIYGNYINDVDIEILVNDINIEILVAAIKNHILPSRQISAKIENLQQKIDFISAISAIGEDLNNLEPKIFIGLSISQIKTFLEQGLKLEKLIPILPELCKAFNLKSGLLASLAGLGLEPKAFFQDNLCITTYSYLDIESLQLLLNNNISAEDIAKKVIQAINHYGADYQETLKTSLQFLVDKKAVDISQISLPVSLLDAYKEALINAQNFLRLVLKVNPSSEADFVLQGGLIKEALDKGTDINSIINGDDFYSYNLNLSFLTKHKELLFNATKPITAQNFLRLVLKVNPSSEADFVLQGGLIKEALDKVVDINDVLEEYSILSIESLSAHREILLNHQSSPLPLENFLNLILKARITLYNDTPCLKQENLKDESIKYAVEKGVDLNFKSSEEFSLTLFEKIFALNKLDMLDFVQVINPNANYTLSAIAWIMAIANNFNINFIVNALQKFPGGFSKEETNDFLRTQGVSHSSAYSLFDIYDLAREVIKATADQQSAVLSSIELQILDINKNTSLVDCINGEYKNIFGFSPLSLTLLAGKVELAIEMIKNGFRLTEKSNNGITPIQILGIILDTGKISFADRQAIREATFEKLDNVDIILNEFGESLIDSFLTDQNLKDAALAKTNDPLFAFYKPNVDLFTPSLHPEQIHIAISMGEGFWSTGLNAVSRLISKEHPEVTFHLVTLEMMDSGGDKFISQFNGWVNPGAGDSFPKGKTEFNKKDWEQSMVLEQAYQKALEKTHELKIPYIGMCAGAQNFALYHGGYIHPLKGYAGGNHTMYFKPATLSHFMAMTKEQQKHALNNCEFPEIAFKGDTAHHYAAVVNKLGSGLQLGAVSEDGIAMSYAHENGLRYATQFHPEHYYHMTFDKHGGINHQKVWLENFIHLTMLHHKHIKQGHDHPEIIFDHISNRLEQCMEAPVCLIEQNIFSNSTIAQVLFDS